ncbi:hypothetical protein I302_105244 [Kwoniella bestiolae CBS 10118]|uniref:Uncharacterized protein n=1 Tax=Kwoniella bestiolae CBS 10118 TaxID=1296100 RepID=A0A1B9FSL4_9TREE|nr:hypothetical protein I302_08532 [Kwoniella bestiolae CBS 10118]OCF21754.1 hypothetical protein I302_08532 [Kwoniella bestiolae CBS 10118]
MSWILWKIGTVVDSIRSYLLEGVFIHSEDPLGGTPGVDLGPNVPHVSFITQSLGEGIRTVLVKLALGAQIDDHDNIASGKKEKIWSDPGKEYMFCDKQSGSRAEEGRKGGMREGFNTAN